MAGLPGQLIHLAMRIVIRAGSDTVTTMETLNPVRDHPIAMASKGRLFSAQIANVKVLSQTH